MTVSNILEYGTCERSDSGCEETVNPLLYHPNLSSAIGAGYFIADLLKTSMQSHEDELPTSFDFHAPNLRKRKLSQSELADYFESACLGLLVNSNRRVFLVPLHEAATPIDSPRQDGRSCRRYLAFWKEGRPIRVSSSISSNFPLFFLLWARHGATN
jgi:hypothetical protein